MEGMPQWKALCWVTIALLVGCGGGSPREGGPDGGGAGGDGSQAADGGDDGATGDADGADGGWAAFYDDWTCDALEARYVELALEQSTCTSDEDCGELIICHAGALGVREGEDPAELRAIYDELVQRCDQAGGSLPGCASPTCNEVPEGSKLIPEGTRICVSA